MFDSSTFYTSPFSYMDNTLSYVLDDLALNSKQDDPFNYLASTYYHLPSPLIYNEIDSYRDLNSATITDDSSIFEESNMMLESNKGEETIIGALEEGHEMNKNAVRKVRASKKDRHSKIMTAHGYRDRRIRLSLEVAGPLFKLQDMLGYDKASSTIKWLLLKSKDAIDDEVLRTKRNASIPSEMTKCSNYSISTSDCEVESIFVVENQTIKDNSKRRRLDVTSNSCVVKENKKKQMIRNTTSKELRNEARARARKRTLEGSMQNSKGLTDHHINGGKLELISTNGGTYSN